MKHSIKLIEKSSNNSNENYWWHHQRPFGIIIFPFHTISTWKWWLPTAEPILYYALLWCANVIFIELNCSLHIDISVPIDIYMEHIACSTHTHTRDSNRKKIHKTWDLHINHVELVLWIFWFVQTLRSELNQTEVKCFHIHNSAATYWICMPGVLTHTWRILPMLEVRTYTTLNRGVYI